MLAWSAMPCHTRTPGRLDARTLAPTAICYGLTAQRADARTHSGSLSHPMYSDGINCARLRRYGGLSHTPAVYHACGWLWRAVAATMLAVAVIVACALLCLYPAAVSAAPGARTPCARTIGSSQPAASVAASGSCRRSVGHLSAVWPVSGGLGSGDACSRWQSLPG